MARVIPGVQVTVVKEVVPQQLAPSGVLGIIGITEKPLPQVERAASWGRFIELCGPGSAYSLPEARQALDNGVYELVISAIRPEKTAAAKVAIPGTLDSPFCDLGARAPGSWANGLRLRSKARTSATGTTFDLTIVGPEGELENHRQLSLAPGAPQYYADALAAGSSIVVAKSRLRAVKQDAVVLAGSAGGVSAALVDNGIDAAGATPVVSVQSVKDGPDVQVTAEVKDGTLTLTLKTRSQAAQPFAPLDAPAKFQLPGEESKLVQALAALAVDPATGKERFKVVVEKDDKKLPGPRDGERVLADGADARPVDYADAIDRLKEEPDVDMVLASVAGAGKDDATAIYSSVISHCQLMAGDSKGRIGFGQVPPGLDTRASVEMAQTLFNERFVLVAPHGVAGAVAGMVGSLPYFHSPTFKAVSGLGRLKQRLRLEEQAALLKGFVVPVALEPSRGNAVLRGLTTDGDQINVRRVADHAVRGVKMIGDLFIGSLNTEDGRNALKQKLAEFLLQMQKEGAIVPSTDKVPDPAFKLDVYSSPQDFAMGIVRIDLAVRPVRAIDFIYATILIET